MKIYRCSKLILSLICLFVIYLVWIAISDYLKKQYIYTLISTWVVVMSFIWLISLIKLRIVITTNSIIIKRDRNNDEIFWQNIKSVRLSKQVICGKPDIHITYMNSIPKKVIIPRYIENFSQLLTIIVERSSNAEIDPIIKKYILK